MTPSSRRLTFAVGTSLLTASLATAGCAKPHVNIRPEQPQHVNEGPEPETEQSDQEQPDQEQPAPEDSPDATTDAPAELDPDADGPSTVNVRHADPK
jgi:hypothetical protein